MTGWILLAAAIIESAREDNDQRFLESDWGQYLIDATSYYCSQIFKDKSQNYWKESSK